MERTNNFDSLRLIGALLVMLSHAAALGGQKEWKVYGDITWGSLGVLIFFSISGYLVTASWRKDPDLGRFLAKRFLRIAPGVLVALYMSYMVVKALKIEGFPGNPYRELNGALWTVEYEVACYLLLACLMLSMPRPLLVGAVLVIAANVMEWSVAWLQVFGAYFVMGGLLYEYPRLRRWSWALVAVGALALSYRPMLAGALIVAPLVIAVGTRSWPGLRSAGRFGDLSYGLYIYAWPVQQIVVWFTGLDAGYAAHLIPTLLITFPLAWLSWRYVERPALGRKPAMAPPASPSGSAEGLLGQVNPATDA